ncbi:hypothetical protein ACORE2_27740 (plasmid) [Bacillus thuringiensis]|uniref:Glycine zipper family protein n=1 Tax=Bacillus thuringiensis TaxID=1428 RepID=A0AAW9JTK1_BACTU|nr:MULTISPECIES: hypothetical protein [Bacillus cereus group]MDZ5479642.1 hypothetical protein [Bacillus thuringiensis]
MNSESFAFALGLAVVFGLLYSSIVAAIIGGAAGFIIGKYSKKQK